MNKKAISCVCLALILIFSINVIQNWISACLIDTLYQDLGNRDWRIQLEQGYTIQQINANEIILIKEEWSETTDIVISSYINSYCCDSQYAGFICKENNILSEPSTQGHEIHFYLLDMHADILWGPLSEADFDELCTSKQILNQSVWINTSPMPGNAFFN